MDFQDRYEAGRLLAQVLKKYKGLKVVVFALPRGGVVTASEIAKELDAPLDLILAHKIGHPHHPEYAIAAISEGGYVMENPLEIQQIDSTWYTQEKERQMAEIRRKREKYIKGRKEISIKDSIAILVDDGIATGLTMKAAVLELKSRKPKKIVVAVPVAPKSTAKALETMVDEFVGLDTTSDFAFRGAVGAYYKDFTQTEDNEVFFLLEENKKREQERENVR
jgi:predicted phosphoribosyltransferase